VHRLVRDDRRQFRCEWTAADLLAHGVPHDPTKPEPTVVEVVDKAMSGEGT